MDTIIARAECSAKALLLIGLADHCEEANRFIDAVLEANPAQETRDVLAAIRWRARLIRELAHAASERSAWPRR